MKIKVLALSAVAAIMVACGGGSTPEDVAKKFHTAITTQDWGTAKDLATTKGKEQVDAAKGMAESMGALGGAEKPAAPEIEEVKCETKEAESTCTCKEKGGKETVYNLKKENDKWVVDYSKMGNMGGGDMEPTPEPEPEPTDVEGEATEGEVAPVE
ncbi:MAG TPA: hypothetical protein PK637_16450 [Flavobacteriales bacterium]|nr:hypothetical protein [Flavobacteriales bacterium]HRE98357.1 hypothetical protein [Flavobacteriales bacterium]HRJ38744.1 hypothetical protein [Flavobacteriales bacterium]